MKKIVFISVVVLIIAAFLVMKWFIDANSKVYKSDEKVLSSKTSSKKALVIYQPSRTNLTTSMANAIGEALNKADYEVTMNYPSEELNYDISKYDVLVFGTPIYAGKCSAPLQAYMKRINSFSNKKVLVFVTGADNDISTIPDYKFNSASAVKNIKLTKGQENTAVNGVMDLIKE